MTSSSRGYRWISAPLWTWWAAWHSWFSLVCTTRRLWEKLDKKCVEIKTGTMLISISKMDLTEGKINWIYCQLNSVKWWNTKTELKQYLSSPFSKTPLYSFIVDSSTLPTPRSAGRFGNGGCGQSVTVPMWILSLHCSYSGRICCSMGSSTDYEGDI